MRVVSDFMMKDRKDRRIVPNYMSAGLPVSSAPSFAWPRAAHARVLSALQLILACQA